MKRVFISYSYKDEEVNSSVNYLINNLAKIGIDISNITNSKSQLRIGNILHMDVTREINRCSLFICFLESNDSNVMFELGYALAKNKKIILIGENEYLPIALRNMMYFRNSSQIYEVLSEVEKYLFNEHLTDFENMINKSDPKKSIETLMGRPDILDSLDYLEFENLVYEWFRFQGYDIERPHSKSDMGYDFLIPTFEGEPALVEVKKYKTTSQVPLAVVRQLIGSMSLKNISCGIIISTAPFTESVRYFIEEIEPRVVLWNLSDLNSMCK